MSSRRSPGRNELRRDDFDPRDTDDDLLVSPWWICLWLIVRHWWHDVAGDRRHLLHLHDRHAVGLLVHDGWHHKPGHAHDDLLLRDRHAVGLLVHDGWNHKPGHGHNRLLVPKRWIALGIELLHLKHLELRRDTLNDVQLPTTQRR